MLKCAENETENFLGKAMHTLDTNAIIYYLNKDEAAYSKIREIMNAEIVYISTISEIELLSFSKLTPKDREEIKNAVSAMLVIPVDSRVSALAADIKRDFKMKLADSIIAATALFTQTTLLTRNVNDFKKIPNLKLLKI